MLENRVITITDGGSGIGLAAVRLFAEAGAKLIKADIDGERAQAAAEAARATGAEAQSVTIDVSDELAVLSMVEAALDYFGRLDGGLITLA